VQSPDSLPATPSDLAGEPSTQRTTPAAESGATWSPRAKLGWYGATFGFLAWLLLWRLAHYGIWDPWELRIADAARQLASHSASPERFELGTWLVSLGFRALGIHEWSGRLPIALSALACIAAVFQWTVRYADARTGVYAALIAGTTPLLLFNARTLLGAAPHMALSSWLGVAALQAVLPPPRAAASSPDRADATSWLWLGAALVLAIVSTLTSGALLSVVAPLAAAVAAAWLAPRLHSARPYRISAWIITLAWCGAIAWIARDVRRDAPEYSMWIGGKSTSLNPPTFDAVLEQVFHAFAPWSALLPIALSRAVPLEAGTTSSARTAPPALQSASFVWIATAYATQTLFLSRYGRDLTFLAIAPLAALVAFTLRDLEREGGSAWTAGIAAALLCGLVLRDFVLFPNSPVHGLPLGTIELPKSWNPKRTLSFLLVPFGLCAALGFAAPQAARIALVTRAQAPYRFLAAQWRRGPAFKAWLIALGGLLASGVIVGLIAYIAPRKLHMPSLAIKVVKPLALAPLALALTVLAAQLLWLGFARLGRHRFVPLLLAAALWGVFMAQVYLPRLSNQFSSREVYTTYNQLARSQEPLGEYRVGSRAAAYYAKGKVIELASVPQLIDHLVAGGQRWAAFPSHDLAEIDHAFRARTGRHLTLVDTRSAHALLAAAQPVPQRADENPLTDAIRKSAPEHVQHPVSVDFDQRIELLGYDLALPHEGYVGAGESFTLTWYFRSVRKLTSAYRVFVHIDGAGQRIHGDHDPVDGKYPVSLWEPGDIVVDRQKIDVPASSHAGEYSIYMGLYSGDTRLPILQGPNAGENRARVGVLRIR